MENVERLSGKDVLPETLEMKEKIIFHQLGGSSGSLGLNGVREKQRADQGAECSQLGCCGN